MISVLSMCVCVLDMNNRAPAQRISNCEFNLWMILQGTESRVAIFHAETCTMFDQSLSRQATKNESPAAVEFRSRISKPDHGSCENV